MNVVEEGPTRTDDKRGETRSRKMVRKIKVDVNVNVMRNATKQNKKNYFIVFDYYNFTTDNNGARLKSNATEDY